MVLEELEHAKKRGANILAEVVGYGANSDAHHVTAPAPEGEGAARCMRLALADAGDEARGRGLHERARHLDAVQRRQRDARRSRRSSAPHAKKLAVSSTKSMTGHMLGAAGGAEAVVAVLALTRGVIPPTINYTTPDPDCDLDYVPNKPREVRVDAVMSNSFGFGGTNAVLLLKRYSK